MDSLDKRILDGMTGQERVKVLLREAGHETYRDFAISIGRYVEEVSMCLTGRRRYDDIRDALADTLGLERVDIDRILDAEHAEEVA